MHADAAIPTERNSSAVRRQRHERQRSWLACLAVVAAVFLIYGQSLRFDFVSFDDVPHLRENLHVVTGINFENLKWDFGIHGPRHWHPLTWLSHQADFTFFGNNSGGHHAVNVVLHAAAASLLFLALHAMTGNRGSSTIVALAFAVHPLNVESVAWISERSNVLCGFFWMATMMCYARYVRHGGWLLYLALAGCHAAALLSKPTAVTLPFALLLLDYWPLSRFQGARGTGADGNPPNPSGARRTGTMTVAGLVREKIPLFAMSLVVSVLALLAQQEAGAVARSDFLPWPARLINAVTAYGWYLEKTIYPAGLSCFYPHPSLSGTDDWSQFAVPAMISGIVIVAVTSIAVLCRRKWPWLLLGWLWYAGILIPMIGLVQVGSQRYADRYAYVPCIGLFMALVWGAGRLRLSVGCIAVLLWGSAAYQQTGVWRNSQTLYAHAVRTDPSNHWAHSNLGVELMKAGDIPAALDHLQRGATLVSVFPLGRYNFGVALQDLGQRDLAIPEFEASLRHDPTRAAAHERLAIALVQGGDLAKAIAHLRAVVQLTPASGAAHYNLGLALARAGKYSEAIDALSISRKLQPGDVPTILALAAVFRSVGRIAEAKALLQSLIASRPHQEAQRLLHDIMQQEVTPGETDGK